jgi:forkhead transcription factor HCM1
MAKNTLFPGCEEPLQIFQDQDDLFDATSTVPMNSHAPMPTFGKQQRRPLGSSTSNAVFNPPADINSFNFSPHKIKGTSPRRPLASSQAANRLQRAAPMAPPTGRVRSTDSLTKGPFLSNFKTAGLPKTHNFDATLGFGKENVSPQMFSAGPQVNFIPDNFFHKSNGKRALMEAAPITDARPSKRVKAEENGLPPHDSFPAITDDGQKPPHSYAQLIGMAILRSPSRKLTLAQIYKWISDTFSFYNASETGWQNSIRHNLSLHKNFIKMERPKDDPGKGNYWAIEKGTEAQFLKEKPTRKAAPTAENLPVMSTRLEPSRPSTAPIMSHESMLPLPGMHSRNPSAPSSSSMLPMSQPAMSIPQEPSSDATILLSDGPAPEETVDKVEDNELPSERVIYSPLPVGMPSSPIMAGNRHERRGTPPPMSQQPTSSVSRSHRNNFASMDDSGYISSLESSVMRPNQKAILLTSEADRPRRRCKARGRAEDEIMRIRNSSPLSPVKARAFPAYGPISSSPLRNTAGNQMLPPSTPAMRLPRPTRAPPSVSPNTSLRMHRENVSNLLGSPRLETGTEEGLVPFSPAFNLDGFEDLNPDFDIFSYLYSNDETCFTMPGAAEEHSPVKRAQRARFDRTVSTSVIGDIPKSVKRPLYAPHLTAAQDSPSRFLQTPSKVFEDLQSPSGLLQESPSKMPSLRFPNLEIPTLPADTNWQLPTMDAQDFLGTGAPNAPDYGGFDIFQGFQKIGSGSQPAQPSNRGNKPSLGRSFSTTF